MKRGVMWIVLSCLMVVSSVLMSCATKTTSSTSTSTPTTQTTAIATTTTTATTVSPTTTATTTTTTGNWWDKLGTPQYGGTMVLQLSQNISNFDPDFSPGTVSPLDAWIEKTIGDNWTLNPAVFDYKINWRPSDYVTGNLMKSYEFTDPGTLVMHLRQGIHWQNIPPANSREFIADDVVFHYDRMFGFGDGFTKPQPAYTVSNWFQIISITATDNYTVVFKWKTPNPEFILETMVALGGENEIENPDAVKLWGNLSDWHHAIGTGPFILQDFVSGSSATLIKNPDYWAYDERYPQNKLPYVDGLKFLIIPDNATSLSALRTGKIDVLNVQSLQTAQSMQKTNPEIVQITTPQTTACTVVPRNDKAPFNDIRVREAMQMAIDLPTIASTYYGSSVVSVYPQTLTSSLVTGWGFPYDQWPQDLKDQYTYNPTAAKQLLATAGYPNGFNTDIVVDMASDLDLLQIVKSYFAAIGINMEIRTMDSASWTSFVKASRKQDALAQQTAGSPLGLTFEPLRQLQRFQTGYSANWAVVSDPIFDSFITKAVADTSIADVKQVVIDANKYVAQQHFAISLLQPMQYAFCQPWLKGYSGQTMSITGEAGQPLLCYFYASRFWIDQNLKKRLGQ